MAETKKSKKVKMYGTGNFLIEDTLYPFRNGEEITAVKVAHVPKLQAEAKRRKLIAERVAALDASQRA